MTPAGVWSEMFFHWITQVAADCSGVRGIRQKSANSDSVLSSTSALSRSSSRGEAAICPTRIEDLTLTCYIQRLQHSLARPYSPLSLNLALTPFRRRSFPSFVSFTILRLHPHLSSPCTVSPTCVFEPCCCSLSPPATL
jgi:hypothetical protein